MKKLLLLSMLMPVTGMIAEEQSFLEKVNKLAEKHIEALAQVPEEERLGLKTPWIDQCQAMGVESLLMVFTSSYNVDPQEAQRRIIILSNALNVCLIPLTQAVSNSDKFTDSEKKDADELGEKYVYAIGKYYEQIARKAENADYKVEAEKTEFTEVSDNEESK